MSNSPPVPPSQEEATRLHQRLLAADPTAPNDAAVAYLEPLCTWLCERNPRVDREACVQATEDAVLALIRQPHSYNPERQTLEVYLRISARGDLLNLLHKEWKHRQGRVSWERVELSPDAGKYLGRDEDPSLPLQIAEQVQETADSVPASVREGLTDPELRVLDLLLRKERRRDVYAEALGKLHLPPEERSKEVKRVKDRLAKRLKRAGVKR
jgi:hypothetical protein